MRDEALHPSSATEPGQQPGAASLLDVIRSLLRELHPERRRPLAVDLDSDLERDLALDSLGRAELLLRLSRAFRVTLPDRLIGEAATPADLLAAVQAAGAARCPGATFPRDEALSPAAEPHGAATLPEVLAFHVRRNPDRPHLRLWQGPDHETIVTYAALDDAARRVAGGLLEAGLAAGGRVAIMLPTGPDFFPAFFGVLLAGGIPVPLYPPFRRAQIQDHLQRQARILSNAAPEILITDGEIKPFARLLPGLVESLRTLTTVEELATAAPLAATVPATGTTVALIQYTSGSTGDPKGVTLTHANLLANIRAIGEALGATSADVVVSWLPLYHDMGLIGCWLGSLYFGAPAVIMPPLSFLADPGRWLRAIHRHRATISAAPNFAYELCLKTLRDEDLAGLDLGSLRVLTNGAEPVSSDTLSRFAQRFTAFGLRPSALTPVYGLAECAVGLAFPPPGRGPLIDWIDRTALSRQGEARPAAPGNAKSIAFAACGRPLRGHQIRIVDEAGREVPERVEGRLQFRGPSATAGYFRNPEKTQALFDGEWLESGDLAYEAGGDVFITGRLKDIVIRAGRKIHPHELEEVAGSVPGVRKGCVAAFASPDPKTGTERLILVAETRLTDASARAGLRRTLAEAAAGVLDQPPDDILLCPPHTVPKTSSGKIRRAAARALYESGGLDRPDSIRAQVAGLALAGIGARLRRIARLAREAGYAAQWWAVLVGLGIVLWPVVIMLPRRAWRHAALRAGLRAFFRLTGTPVLVEGGTATPPAIIAANHASYLDAAVLAAVLPGTPVFLAKHELAGQAVAGPFLRRLGTVFVHRGEAAGVSDADVVLDRIRAGEQIVAFPEGTFTRTPGLLGFHLGAFMTACRAGVPVAPIAITGTRSLLRADQWFPRHGAIRVHLGQKIAPEGADFHAAVRLRDAVRAAILARCGEPDLADEPVSLPAAPSAPG
ncbi:AMP-binding protein [Methylobacterium nodulans]|uniref:AMP-dependent synthetase and ligase n=1 Tax=Methylobacterium nodulans (strain LMG 21967 / CNCM I-2342 / ORS 2060) TaxID=460265 RepID=B8IX26_METNO|nr:AMP-binding protein [Methylobacterium nodulans]ACL63067.1 AMP-dependent synthetase and ligase [Methylobacterium nodulans ORS 2060]